MFLHHHVCSGWNRVARNDLVFFIHDDNLRMQVLLVLDHDSAHHPSRFVNFPLHGYAGDHIPEFHFTGPFRQDRHVVRIPLNEGVTLLHRLTVADGDHRTDNDIVAFELPAILRVYRHRTVLIQHNKVTVYGLNNPKIVEVHVTVVLRFDNRLLKKLSSGSTNVECTHRQLSTGLADALCSDDANRLTELHHPAGRQVPAVALRANTTLRFTGEDGADFQLLDADLHERVGLRLLDQLVCLDNRLFADRISDGFTTYAAYDSCSQIDYFIISFVDWTNDNSVSRSAVWFNNDHVLGGIHQFSSQIP